MLKTFLLLISVFLVGCAVSSPKMEVLYSGKTIPSVLIVPKSGFMLSDEIKEQIEKTELGPKLLRAFVEYDKAADALAIKSALESTRKIERIEVYNSGNIDLASYGFVIEATGKMVPDTHRQNCDFSNFIAAFTIGIIPSFCSRYYLYSAYLVKGEERELIEYGYESTTVVGWVSYLLRYFDGWGDYYDDSISEANFGQKILNAANLQCASELERKWPNGDIGILYSSTEKDYMDDTS